MRKSHALCLAALALAVTGCPSNQYTVELTPRGKVIERKLTFYCADGTDTNGVPNYQAFSADELRAIRRCYPRGGVVNDGQRHIATGEFAAALPDDVGGAGSYTLLTNSLGSAAFYVERFRGSDDVAARVQALLKTADKLVDYIIGWSRQELGGERHYQDLRRFLDGDFRQDVRNLGLHGWMAGAAITTRAPAPEEFAIRFAQYLVERGYFKMEDAPELARSFTSGDGRPVLRLFQQLVAQKLKVPRSKPMPQSLEFMTDPDRFDQSWESYLATTTEYRIKLRHWQMKKISAEAETIGQKMAGYFSTQSSTNKTAAPTIPDKPQPSEVANELISQLLESNFSGPGDHLTVRLRLPAAPTHTNGKWDDAGKQVVWEADLAERTGSIQLPAFCYASWMEAQETFQRTHFGNVVLKGDDLLQYCLWRGALDDKQAREWETFLSGMQPSEGLADRIGKFRFSGGPLQAASTSPPENPVDFPVRLIKSALSREAEAGNK